MKVVDFVGSSKFTSVRPLGLLERNLLRTPPSQTQLESYSSDSQSERDTESESEEQSSASISSGTEDDEDGSEDEGIVDWDEEIGDDTFSSSRSVSTSSSIGSSISSFSSSIFTDDEEFVTSDSGWQTVRFSSNSRQTLAFTPKAMMQTDNLGVLALLIPVTGLSTMLCTEVLACSYHFDCSKHYPTLSYAATFKPEGYAFTIGMCLTSIFIFAVSCLYFWFLRLRFEKQETKKPLFYVFLGAGTIAAANLFGLAVMDMRNYHDAHITFTVVFFIFAWITMVVGHILRRKLVHEDDAAKPLYALYPSSLQSASFWTSLHRFKRLRVRTAHALGQLFLYTGLASTFLFLLFFLCVNGLWPNPLGFTAVQEAFFEAMAIICQLLFMGTLSCELTMLSRLVEQRDYMELERSE